MSAPRLRAPVTARRGKFGFRENTVIEAAAGAPSGGGGTYHNGGMGASAPITYLPA